MTVFPELFTSGMNFDLSIADNVNPFNVRTPLGLIVNIIWKSSLHNLTSPL